MSLLRTKSSTDGRFYRWSPIVRGRRRTACLIVLLSTVVCASPVRGESDDDIRLYDLLVMKVGTRIQGTILETGDLSSLPRLRIRRRGGGEITIERSEIKNIIRRRSPDDVYNRKRTQVEAIDNPSERAVAESELAAWCATPLVTLDGGAPRPRSALSHYLGAIESDPAFHSAYPHIFSILSATRALADGPDGDAQSDEATRDRIEMELRVAELAEEGDYKDPELQYRLGVVTALWLREPERALPYLKSVLESDYQNRGHLRIARSLIVKGYVRSNDLDSGRRVYESIIVESDDDPRNFEPYFELGNLHALAGETGWEKAAEYYELARKIQPQFWPLAGRLAAMSFWRGDYAGAEERLNEYLSGDPDAFEPVADLALMNVYAGKLKETKALLNTLSEWSGPEAEKRLHLLKGVLAEQVGKWQLAAESYHSALGVDEDSGLVRLRLAMALILAGETSEGRRLAKTLLDESDASPHIFAACSRVMANAELAEGNRSAAVKLLTRASELQAKDASLNERLGILLMQEGNLEGGAKYVQTSANSGDTRAASLAALGYYNYSVRNFVEARKYFEQVVELTADSDGESESSDAELYSYALGALSLIGELGSLETWRVDFSGEDEAHNDGWEEVEHHGIAITRAGQRMLFSGEMLGDPEEETSALLERVFETARFNRVVMRAKVEEGDRVRVGVRVEVERHRGSVSGIYLYRDYDGFVRVQVAVSGAPWEELDPSEDERKSKGTVYLGNTSWPNDGEAHTLEVRRLTPEVEKGRKSRSTRASYSLYFDGQLVASRLRVSGMNAHELQLGVITQTDHEGQSYAVSIEQFKVYRERKVASRRGKK